MKFIFLALVLLFTRLLFAQGYICAVGGGSEDYNDWSDKPYGWIVENCDSGKILILSYTDQSDWIPNYFQWLGASSAVNYKIPSREAADLQTTYDELISADAIFIKGGDQWKYVDYWKETKTEEAIRHIYQNGGVVAGTSAGAMILSDVVFTAKSGTVYPKPALQNPLIRAIDLDDDFLDLVPDVIFDTHFIERGRAGRLIAFLLKLHILNDKDVLGVGIDDKTAICIDSIGIGTVYGTGAVSIFQMDARTHILNQDSKYTIENLRCDQLTENWEFDFFTKSIHQIPESAKPVDSTRALQLPKTNLILHGSNSLSDNTNFGLPHFLNEVNIAHITIILNSGFENAAAELGIYLSNKGYNFSTAVITEQNLNDETNALNISVASCIIILGDNLGMISRLSDATTAAGQALTDKINSHTPLYFVGSAGKIAGENYIDNVDDYYLASYKGLMTNNEGLNIFGDLIFQPMIYDDIDFYENRTSALLWGLMKNRKRIGLYLDNNDYARISSAGNSIESIGSLPIMLIDARDVTYVDSSRFIISGGSSTRQIAAMDNLRYNFSSLGKKYSIVEGKFETVNQVQTTDLKPVQYYLGNNYPNPFNNTTVIDFSITSHEFVRLTIYDILGNLTAELLSEYLPPGYYSFSFDTADLNSELTSGVYIYRLQAGVNSLAKKMVILK